MSSELLNQIFDRFDKKGITYEEREYGLNKLSKFIVFDVQAGREIFKCAFDEEDTILGQLIDSEFEKFNFIVGYQAIWSSENKKIECEIALASLKSSTQLESIMEIILRIIIGNTLLSDKSPEPHNNNPIRNVEFEPINNINVSIGECSQEFAILTGCRFDDYSDGIEKNKFTLKLSNVEVKTHNDAQKLIVKIANSLFFQIERAKDIELVLVKEREYSLSRKAKASLNRSTTKDETKLGPLGFEYDEEAMAYYWYAKNTNDIPLLQFLAYYQVIEFYFPIFSELEINRQLKIILKDPRFNPDRDTDLIKIIKLIKESNGGKSFGNESEQLAITLKFCINNDELKEFLCSDIDRKNYYTAKESKKLSEYTIPLEKNKEYRLDKIDLVQVVAERIYEIRCQIVHSKSDSGKKLHPYSPEVKNLVYDLELVEFIAQKVLIERSRPLSLIQI